MWHQGPASLCLGSSCDDGIRRTSVEGEELTSPKQQAGQHFLSSLHPVRDLPRFARGQPLALSPWGEECILGGSGGVWAGRPSQDEAPSPAAPGGSQSAVAGSALAAASMAVHGPLDDLSVLDLQDSGVGDHYGLAVLDVVGGHALE